MNHSIFHFLSSPKNFNHVKFSLGGHFIKFSLVEHFTGSKQYIGIQLIFYGHLFSLIKTQDIPDALL